MSVIDFFTAGEPATQAGTRAVPIGGGRMRQISGGSKGLPMWRVRIAQEAQQQTEGLIDGPVAVVLHFILPRPKSKPKRVRWPDGQRADADKLARAVLDAITQTLIHDDGQVCSLAVLKTYAVGSEQPGVRVVLRPLWGEEAGEPYETAIKLLVYASASSQTAGGWGEGGCEGSD